MKAKILAASIILLSAVSLCSATDLYGTIGADIDGCYIGAFVDYEPANSSKPPLVLSYLPSYETNMGRHLGSVMWFQSWGSSANGFMTAECNALIDRDSIPHITWEPWKYLASDPVYSLQNIINGDFDPYITSWAQSIKAFNKPVFLRFAHEMNGNWYPWSGEQNGGGLESTLKYIAAWRHVHDIFSSAGADNVTWVWCVYGGSVPDEPWNNADNYYPGDDYVDWIAIDNYNWGGTRPWGWNSFDALFRQPYDLLTSSHPGKPVMIAEFACSEVYDWATWDKKGPWIIDAFAKMKTQYPAVKSYNWFNIDKSGLGETNWFIESSESSKAGMFSAMSDTAKYLDRIYFPEIELSSPLGGERWKCGEQHLITWNASSEGFPVRGDGISIYYSRSEGSVYLPIAAGISNTGNYEWTTPQMDSSAVRIKIIAKNTAGNTAVSESAPFTISDSTGTGDIPIGYPVFSLGYTDPGWKFSTFESTPLLFHLGLENVSPADRPQTVVAYNLNGSPSVTKADVTDKKMAVLNHVAGFLLTPGRTTSPFPSIWIKGDSINPIAGSEAPGNYLTGDGASRFYQTGLTLQAPYYDQPNLQWSVYVYSDKDILRQVPGPIEGRILDPRTSTMRWFAWANDMNGIARKQWIYKEGGNPISYNTVPIISTSATPQQTKSFLTGTSGTSVPEAEPGFDSILSSPEILVPDNGKLYYNSDRNIIAGDNANGTSIVNRSQTGLVYVSPSGAQCHRTEYLHIQFMVLWPPNVGGIVPGGKNCNIGFYQRTTP
ncbi:MAG: glycosyl hydrolase [Candidatus Margulisiibacteriota bacterium]